MSQLEPQGPADAGEGSSGEQGAAPPAPAPQTAPSTAPAAGDEDGFVRVPRVDLKSHGGSWHSVKQDANAALEARDRGLFDDGMAEFRQLCRELKLSPTQFVEYQRTGQLPDGYAAPPMPDGQASEQPAGLEGDTPLTVDAYRRLQAEDERRRQDEQEQAEAVQAAQAEVDFAIKALEELKIPGDSRTHEAGEILFPALVQKAIEGRLPAYLSAEKRQEMAESMPSTEADLAKAKELLGQFLGDVRQEAAVAAAEGQLQVPSATNAGGPSGRTAPPNVGEMSEHELDQELMSATFPPGEELPSTYGM